MGRISFRTPRQPGCTALVDAGIQARSIQGYLFHELRAAHLEIYTDGGLQVCVKGIICEPEQQARFSYRRVADKQQLQSVIFERTSRLVASVVSPPRHATEITMPRATVASAIQPGVKPMPNLEQVVILSAVTHFSLAASPQQSCKHAEPQRCRSMEPTTDTVVF